MTLLLAVLPVVVIPILMGGVSWQHAVLVALSSFSALCLALSASLVASSSTRTASRALVNAILLSFVILVFHFLGTGTFGLWQAGVWGRASLADALDAGVYLSGLGREFPTNSQGLTATMWAIIWQSLLFGTVLAMFLLLAAVMFAAWQIRRNWREEPPARWVQATQRTFCTPVVAKGFFRRWMKRLLERNPIGWLERRTWTGRVLTWSWFAIIISMYSAVLSNNTFFRGSSEMQTMVAWFLMGSIAASVAASFRRERESGVLELLLVAPMKTSEIIGGRLRGIWLQFLPSVFILLFIWGYFATLFREERMEFPKIFFFAGTFLTLPVIGLYFSVRSRSFISAFLMTLICGLVLPRILERLAMYIASLFMIGTSPFDEFEFSLGTRPGAVLVQVLFAALLGPLLYVRLDQRNFPMERASA